MEKANKIFKKVNHSRFHRTKNGLLLITVESWLEAVRNNPECEFFKVKYSLPSIFVRNHFWDSETSSDTSKSTQWKMKTGFKNELTKLFYFKTPFNFDKYQ